MSTIGYLLVAVVAFVGGVLVGRKNKNSVDKVVDAAKNLKK